jgi:RHS repeat-associated protein
VETWGVYGIGGELVADYAAYANPVYPQKEYGYRNGQLLITAEAQSGSSTNVALAANGGVAVASTTLAPYYPAYVTDGSRRAVNSAGWLDNTYQSFPDWIEVDFNASKTISEIDVITQQDDYQNPIEPTLTKTFSLYGITAFDVQYWNGSAWVTVPNGSVTGNNKVWRQFTFTSITTSKIRVVVNAGADNAFSRVVEVEAWTASGSPANLNWLVTDQLGTPRMVFDKTGALATVKRHDYLPFGEELSAGQGVRTTTLGYGAVDGIRQKFTSQERDNETGLDYMHARYFASAQGRFSSADTFGGSTGNPQSLNRYAYVNNNPLNFTDPTGHMPSIQSYSSTRDGDGKAYSWDDPTSPQAVLQSYTALPERYENEISDWAHQSQARHDQEEARHQAALEDNINFLLSLGDNTETVAVTEASLAVPQDPQSQEDFEASPEYHKLLASYTDSLLKAIPGTTVQWKRDGKIQYIDFPGSYEATIVALEKAGYFTGVTNIAWNPIGHAGGKEFRDPLSVGCELSFHFAVLYPQYKSVGGRISIRGDPIPEVQRLLGVTRAFDVHIDRASPLHPGSLSTHAKDFWRDLERKYGFR